VSADDPLRGGEKLPAAKPSQSRSVKTFEAILAAAAEILAESGFDALSTNLVCARCGLTPPALYRYFGDKFAILEELARRLMDTQDAALIGWIEGGGLAAKNLKESFASNYAIQTAVNEVTEKFVGGLAVMQAMRSVRRLRDIRLASHEYAADRLFQGLRQHHNGVSDEDLQITSRVIVDISYFATEMVLQERDRDRERVTKEVMWMLTLYLAKFAERPALQGSAKEGLIF
jgi:AcrR family transcriptional regulator